MSRTGLVVLLLLLGGVAPAESVAALVYVKGVGGGGTRSEVWIADDDGGDRRRLTPGRSPRISPDGRWVAFVRGRRPDLFLVRASGGRARFVRRWAIPLEWTRDSRRIVVQRGRTLAIVDRERLRLTALDRGDVLGWSLSPGGRSLVYAIARRRTPGRICSDATDLYVVPLAGGRPRRLTSDGRSVFPLWGRDAIAYARFSRDRCSTPEIWRVRADGSAKARIALTQSRFYRTGGYGVAPLAWMPGGRLMLAVRTEWGNEPAVLDVRTGRITRIRGGYFNDVSRDGRFILATAGGAEFPNDVVILGPGGRRRVVDHGFVWGGDWNR